MEGKHLVVCPYCGIWQAGPSKGLPKALFIGDNDDDVQNKIAKHYDKYHNYNYEYVKSYKLVEAV